MNVLLFLLALVSTWATAQTSNDLEFTAPTSTGYVIYSWAVQTPTYCADYGAPTAAEACAKIGGQLVPYNLSCAPPVGQSSTWNYGSGTVHFGTCDTAASCPSKGGWTLNAQQSCQRNQCLPGAVRNMELDNQPCEWKKCKTSGAPDGWYVGSPYRVDETVFKGGIGCDQATGCALSFNSCFGGDSSVGSTFRSCNLVGYNGKACPVEEVADIKIANSDGSNPEINPTPPPQMTPEQKLAADEQNCTSQGMCPMTINGVTSCAVCGKSRDTTRNTSKDAQGNDVVVEIVTYLDCGGGECVTRRDVTTTTLNNGTQLSQTTTGGSQEGNFGGFCTQNPSSAICRAASDECQKNPDRVSCKNLGEAGDVGELTTKTIGPSLLEPVSLAGGAGSCPADVPLPHGATFSWKPVCDFASGLRLAILAVAWLSAGLIVIGARSA